jgi:thioesterase domain-containing protein/acyl carrier protein
MADKRDIATVQPATRIQSALLVAGTLGEDSGFLQVEAELQGPLTTEQIASAWAAVVAHHPALRTTCHPRPDQAPLLVTWKKVPVEPTFVDWRDVPAEEALAAWKRDDRARGLDLGERPAWRLTVARRADDRHLLLWTCHHVLFDGWSSGTIVSDLLRALAGDFVPMPAAALQAYVAQQRLRNQPLDDDAAAFWTERLADLPRPPRLRLRARDDERAFATTYRTLDAALITAVAERAQRAGVTVGVVAHAAWGLVWSRLVGCEEAVFGTVVAGRGAPIDGLLDVAGNLANALPVRLEVGDTPTDDWLVALRDQLFALHPHEHVALDVLRDLADLPAHVPLFESLVVLENLPGVVTHGEVTLVSMASGITSALPVTLGILPGDTWDLHFQYDRGRMDAAGAAVCLTAFETALQELASGSAPRTVRDGLITPALVEDGAYEAPADPTELALAVVWCRVLGLPEVSVVDDFFVLGGSSLTAVVLMEAIEEEFGVRLPLNTLASASTVRDMARHLASGEQPTWRSLVPLRPGRNEGPPLFCVHAGGGHVLYYRTLATALDPVRSVYGLEPVGLDGSAPLSSIPAMARHYVQEMRQVQPRGPYRLLGYCLGATLCIAIASELEARGETVDLLVIVDSIPYPRSLVRRIEARVQDARRRRLRGLVMGAWLDHRARRDLRTAPASARHAERVRRAGAEALVAYPTPRVTASAVLVPSRKFDVEPYWRTRTLRWAEHVGAFEVVAVIDVDHECMLDPPAATAIARLVDARLAVLDQQLADDAPPGTDASDA